jgi:bacterioferritin (cytochrome b1)
MLTGAVLGIIIALLAFLNFWQYARIMAYKELNKAVAAENKALSDELTKATDMLRRVASVEQERLKMKESIVVNFTEDQITNLAMKISVRVKTMMEAEQAAALQKMN